MDLERGWLLRGAGDLTRCLSFTDDGEDAPDVLVLLLDDDKFSFFLLPLRSNCCFCEPSMLERDEGSSR